jgi:hypothetical protein
MLLRLLFYAHELRFWQTVKLMATQCSQFDFPLNSINQQATTL